MIMTIWGGLRTIGAFVSAFRIYFIAAAVVTAGVTAFNYIDNHGEMKATLTSNKVTIQKLELNVDTLNDEIKARNAQIARMNERRTQEIMEAQARLDKARQTVKDLRERTKAIQAELGNIRLETLEAIRDDEEFANWANAAVPSTGWRLLQQAGGGVPD